jgi:hypothetical protein
MSSRAPYAEVGSAIRDASRRANEAQLSDGQRKVFLAVIALVASYSRLEDRVYVADVAGLSRLSNRHTRDCLKFLHEQQLIVWKPRRGKSVKSLLGLHPASKSGTPRPPVSVPEPEGLEQEKAALTDGQKRIRDDGKAVVMEFRRPRRHPEKTPREDNGVSLTAYSSERPQSSDPQTELEGFDLSTLPLDHPLRPYIDRVLREQARRRRPDRG